jgi:hypothetical protein
MNEPVSPTAARLTQSLPAAIPGQVAASKANARGVVTAAGVNSNGVGGGPSSGSPARAIAWELVAVEGVEAFDRWGMCIV